MNEEEALRALLAAPVWQTWERTVRDAGRRLGASALDDVLGSYLERAGNDSEMKVGGVWMIRSAIAFGGGDRVRAGGLMVRALREMDTGGGGLKPNAPAIHAFGQGPNIAPFHAVEREGWRRAGTPMGDMHFLAIWGASLPGWHEGSPAEYVAWLLSLQGDPEKGEVAVAAAIWVHALWFEGWEWFPHALPPAAVELVRRYEPAWLEGGGTAGGVRACRRAWEAGILAKDASAEALGMLGQRCESAGILDWTWTDTLGVWSLGESLKNHARECDDGECMSLLDLGARLCQVRGK
ncbi:MAG: hypothetical protein HUU06_05645 [Planctomycetaceae bacterium]|nr:hypothetical protein [Planctomycetota bacterium]NUN52256.1 hypothetical protein [Planctomycetaceae bacterium]